MSSKGINRRKSGVNSANQGKATKQKDKAKPRGQKCTAMAQLRMLAAIIRWPTADLPVHSDY